MKIHNSEECLPTHLNSKKEDEEFMQTFDSAFLKINVFFSVLKMFFEPVPAEDKFSGERICALLRWGSDEFPQMPFHRQTISKSLSGPPRVQGRWMIEKWKEIDREDPAYIPRLFSTSISAILVRTANALVFKSSQK
jgi:hypothetical protein